MVHILFWWSNPELWWGCWDPSVHRPPSAAKTTIFCWLNSIKHEFRVVVLKWGIPKTMGFNEFRMIWGPWRMFCSKRGPPSYKLVDTPICKYALSTISQSLGGSLCCYRLHPAFFHTNNRIWETIFQTWIWPSTGVESPFLQLQTQTCFWTKPLSWYLWLDGLIHHFSL
jgi:hypothetical protein